MTRTVLAVHARRMTSRTHGLLLLVVLSACGGGSGGDTGTGTGPGSSSSGGPVGSSGPTTGATGSDGSGTSSPPTSGGITGGATGSTSTSSGPGTTSEPLTTGSSTTGTSSGESSSSSSASSSGGGGLACVDVSGDYGPCEAIIGYGFDGTSCRAFSGCNCAPHCDDFAPDAISCAIECASAGECNPSALHPAGINKDPVVKGSFCDELDACIVDAEHVAWLMKIFEKVECEAANFPCEQGQNCHLLWQGMLGEAQWPQVCAASLLPGADLQCVVWGP